MTNYFKNHLTKEKTIIIFTLLTLSQFTLRTNNAYGIILDDVTPNKNERKFCNQTFQPGEISPIKESIERGKHESFAQTTGTVKIKFRDKEHKLGFELASGVLIAPDLLLTCAHAVDKCQNSPLNCQFIINDNNGKEICSTAKEIFINEEFHKMITRESEIEMNAVELNKKIVILKNLSNEIEKRRLESEIREEKEKFNQDKKYIENNNHYDIALIKLHKSIEDITINKKYMKLDFEHHQNLNTAYVVSSGDIKKNSDGDIYAEQTRHIAIVKVENEANGNLKSTLTTPQNYMTKHAYGAPNRFSYKGDPFLQGATQESDSGGPLIGSFKKEFKIMGITEGAKPGPARTLEDTYPPAATYYNTWTSIATNKEWLQNTLENLGYYTWRAKYDSQQANDQFI